ncbi:molybdopterin-dependent oxidoreductase [Actinotalea sp. M2MS4P-6]|uniref:molybdopterin-dependent oxidoreductase n=1 Tax=Actinotalea sp. M2MS4P-6 TaxID=2983762 RepID=UPI0021E4EE1A|nr:molybdopterin-dependent oxidoreductase [Actinotalea sp. M2MS4P-6]MCV2393778.1 molybdopterin-dependent oxidoreductase [Actinotalea sp. M2MS4P-6]
MEQDLSPGSDPAPRRRAAAALAGLLAAVVTFGVGHLVAGIVDPPASPLASLGDTFIDLTPEWLKEAAIAAFGTHDKLALLVGMVVVVGIAAALVGVLALRHLGVAQGIVVVLGAVAGIAAQTRPQTGQLALFPSLVGAAAGAFALRWLILRLTGPGTEPADVRDTGRRAFLGAAAAVGVVGVLSAIGGTVIAGARSTAAAVKALVLPAAARPAPPVPADAQSPVAGVVDVVTPNSTFYRIDTAFTVPQVDPDTWRLRVHGLVDREVTLTFDDLLASDLVEAYVTLTCVSNSVGGDLAGNAKWLGLPVREVLAMAGPQADADMVLSRSVDGFTASTPLEVLTDDRDALLAVGMNGQPLPAEHGFPVRMVVPGLYGYVSATKWVSDLEVTRFADATAYWTVRGWSERGPVKLASRIEVPRSGSTVDAGPVDVGGTAWAQHTGISGVEVQVDDGPWQPATLAGEISVDAWRQWSWRWADATSGRHLLRVRAIDNDGMTQTGERSPAIPDGATGWHEISVFVA